MPHFILFIICLNLSLVDDPKVVKQQIVEILTQPEFQDTREEFWWKYIGEDLTPDKTLPPSSEISFEFIGIIAKIFELLLWLIFSIGIILLIIYGSRWFKPLHPQKKDNDIPTNPQIWHSGVNIILPTNINQEAWTLWQSKQFSLALSLLYRGALSVLIKRDGLNIDDSATESECLRLIKSKQTVELTDYFSGLSRAWQNIAYAERKPSDVEAQQLCEEWKRYFG